MFLLKRDGHNSSDLEDSHERAIAYQDYLRSIRDRLPAHVYDFATRHWRGDFDLRRDLHDSWVEELTIREPASGQRNESRELEIRVRLLGPYHDGRIEMMYSRVEYYRLETPTEFGFPLVDPSHGDWLVDEVRLSERGHILHEIEFSSGSHWIIECHDLRYAWLPLGGDSGV